MEIWHNWRYTLRLVGPSKGRCLTLFFAGFVWISKATSFEIPCFLGQDIPQALPRRNGNPLVAKVTRQVEWITKFLYVFLLPWSWLDTDTVDASEIRWTLTPGTPESQTVDSLGLGRNCWKKIDLAMFGWEVEGQFFSLIQVSISRTYAGLKVNIYEHVRWFSCVWGWYFEELSDGFSFDKKLFYGGSCMVFENFLTFQRRFFISSPRRGDLRRTCPAEMFALSLVPSMLGPFCKIFFTLA